MAEKFSFFDPVETELGFDREYNAQEFTDYFKTLVTTGVMKGAGAELKVTTNGSNMVTEVDVGIGFIEGRYYANTSKLAHTHDTEVLGKDRIDRVVVRLDLNTDARHVKSFVKKGAASASPVPPSLQQDTQVYELSLAQVKVVGGQTYINAANITDEHGKDDVCPWAGSGILPNFNDAELEALVNGFNNHIKANNPHNITPNVIGAVPLVGNSDIKGKLSVNGIEVGTSLTKQATGDWNNYTENGTYIGTSMLNQPPDAAFGNSYVVTVVNSNDGDFVFQTAYSANSYGMMFKRNKKGPNWGVWIPIISKDAVMKNNIAAMESGEYIGNNASFRNISLSKITWVELVLVTEIRAGSQPKEPWGYYVGVQGAGFIGNDRNPVIRYGVEDASNFQVGNGYGGDTSLNKNGTKYKYVCFGKNANY